jgi:hypothetical protein
MNRVLDQRGVTPRKAGAVFGRDVVARMLLGAGPEADTATKDRAPLYVRRVERGETKNFPWCTDMPLAAPPYPEAAGAQLTATAPAWRSGRRRPAPPLAQGQVVAVLLLITHLRRSHVPTCWSQ